VLAVSLFCSMAYMLFTEETRAAASGNWNEQPEKLTLLTDTLPSADSGPVAVISAFQSVQEVQAVPANGDQRDALQQSERPWRLIKTWYGEKWIQSGPSVVKEKYYPVRLDVSFTDIVELHDFPGDGQPTGGALSPQTVTAIGQLFICNDETFEALQPESGRCRPWYHVVTYLGEKWMSPVPANTMEHYEQTDAAAALTPSAAAYQEKLRTRVHELEPQLASRSLEFVSLHINNNIARLEVRPLYRHREPLSSLEVEELKHALFQAVGGAFPLSVTTFTLADQVDLKGKIMSIDKMSNRVLVVDYEHRMGREQAVPKASWLGLADDSHIHRDGDAVRLSLDDLRIGQIVQVWTARFALLSYPGQTTAYEVSIVGEELPGEAGTPLSTILDLDLSRIDKIELIFTDGTTRIIQEPDILEAIAERLQPIRPRKPLRTR
jgi:hypothetical protein